MMKFKELLNCFAHNESLYVIVENGGEDKKYDGLVEEFKDTDELHKYDVLEMFTTITNDWVGEYENNMVTGVEICIKLNGDR